MLTDQIQEELKQAQLARDEVKVSTLRLLLSEVKNAEIFLRQSSGHNLSDEDVISVIQKEAKKRKESVASFRSGNREELAQKEEAELKILESYLPLQISDEELTNLVQEAITEVGATGMSDMGKVIQIVLAKVKGQVDGSRVSALAKAQLNG